MIRANTISLAEVYRIMRRGEPFDVVVCSFSKSRGSGGDRNEYFGCTLKQKEVSQNDTTVSKNETSPARNPNHNQHITVLLETKNGAIEKIRPHLIEKINGQDVAL